MPTANQELRKINGGFAKVPGNLRTKTQLKEAGLKPIGQPVAQVWTSHKWVLLYDVAETTERAKASENQLAALARANDAREQNRTCKVCGDVHNPKDLVEHDDGTRICRYCIQNQRREQRMLEAERTICSWYGADFVILDTETTGLGEDDEIVEISIIDSSGETLLDTLVKATVPIPEFVSDISGITPDMLEDAPTWRQVYPVVKDVLQDKLALIFNAHFDTRLLNQTCERYGLKPVSFRTECVMAAYAAYHGRDNGRISLRDASGEDTEHRAIGDCQTTLRLLQSTWEASELLRRTASSIG